MKKLFKAKIFKRYAEFVKARTSSLLDDRLHAGLGLCTEAGEFLDGIKKWLAYGRDLDLVNLDEEIGDMLFYIQVYANTRGKTIDDYLEQNMAKLSARYKEKFTPEEEQNRQLDIERQILEDTSGTDLSDSQSEPKDGNGGGSTPSSV